MPLQYVKNNKGETVAVQIPIEEWNNITEKHADIEELPNWQKRIIDIRLEEFKNHPENTISKEDFEKILDKDETY
jgi:hypothetical protein